MGADVDGRTDRGLAGERTDLAWTRTAVGFAAVGGAILHVSPVVGLLVLAMCGAVWAAGRAPARGRSVLLVTVVTTTVSLAALALVVLTPPGPGLVATRGSADRTGVDRPVPSCPAAWAPGRRGTVGA
ncbi:MAG TPA: DUF202 domain-containing protein [Mycobacteriales bacterium]|jgi:hypothetical protein|nr:DUF202 domain-containing protein [Mycobacteriales bacterium]